MTLEKLYDRVLASYYYKGLTSKNASQVLAWINWKIMREAKASPLTPLKSVPLRSVEALSRAERAWN